MSQPSVSIFKNLSEHPGLSVLALMTVLSLLFPLILLVREPTAPSSSSLGSQRITSYDGTLELDRSGQGRIQENILYNFRNTPGTGFSRILTRTRSIGGYFPVDTNLSVQQITRSGRSEPFTIIPSVDKIAAKIGNAQTRLEEEQPYTITYEEKHLVVRTEAADEVRFSPTDFTAGVPIDQVDFTVHAPLPPTSADCYVYNRTIKNTSVCRVNIEGTTIRFDTPRWIEADEGLMITLTFPRGTFMSALIQQPIPRIPVWLFVILAHLLLITVIWFILGRDEKGSGTIIPSDELLEEIKPYEAGSLLHQGPSYASFVSMIIDLAERKAIKLVRFEGGGYLAFDIERDRREVSLDAVEAAVLKRLFQYPTSNDPKDEEMSSASFGNYSEESKRAYGVFESLTYKRLTTRGWYNGNILAIQLLSATLLIGWTAGLYLFLQNRINDPSLHFIEAQIPLLLPLLYFMPRLTKTGAYARERVKGLAWYLRVAEKERISFHEGPKKLLASPGKLLAYAVALGVEKDWPKQFLKGFLEVKK